MLTLNCFCYYFWGLEGMGISFLIGYFLYAVQVYVVAKKRYGFKFESEVLKLCAIHLTLLVAVFLIEYNFNPIIQYSVGLLIIATSFIYSVRIMENKIGFLASLRARYKRG